MTATFIDGTRIAEDIKAEVATEVKELQKRGVHPGYPSSWWEMTRLHPPMST